MTKNAILVHGTWGSSKSWDVLKPYFEERGYTVHTPTLRHHDLPVFEAARKVADVSTLEYVDDLVQLAESMDSPPLLVGHSLGGLLVQLVAARTRHEGVICLAPAPAAYMFGTYPSTLMLFLEHFMQPNFWKRPLYPMPDSFKKYVTNNTPPEVIDQLFDRFVPESGKCYTELAMWWLTPFNPATKVDYDRVTAPVLCFAGDLDRCIHRNVVRASAKKFPNGEFVLLNNCDHVGLVLMPNNINEVMAKIDLWTAEHGLFKSELASAKFATAADATTV